MQIKTRQVDYADSRDAADLIRLLSEYARLEFGGDVDTAPDLSAVPDQLAAFPTAFSVLAYAGAEHSVEDVMQPAAIGLINCFFGFSTFAGRRLVNVHDVIVTAAFRGRGVSGVMLEAVEQIARKNDCCRLTLEVYTDNEPALRAYTRYGFHRDPTHPDVDAIFLRKSL